MVKLKKKYEKKVKVKVKASGGPGWQVFTRISS